MVWIVGLERGSAAWGCTAADRCCQTAAAAPNYIFRREKQFADHVLDLFDEGPSSNPKKTASVAQMMPQAGKKDVGKLKRLIDEANGDYQWPLGKLIFTLKPGSKIGRGGGKLGWAAIGTALQDLHRTLRVP